MPKVKRLLEQFKPDSYKISLKIDEASLAFTGQVIIVGFTPKDSRQISLHSKDLDILSFKINGESAKTSTSDQDELIAQSEKVISKGECTLEIHYTGKITDTMHGIYSADYTDIDGKNQKIIATQFESHHAREAFPCIDEPMAKATFELEISHSANSIVLSNMPISKQNSKGASTITSFEPTPIMSTYLLAFAIGDIKNVSTKTKRGVEVNVWSTPAFAEHLDFALETATRGLDFFEEYFEINYPLPKCDLIGIPSFSAGAMENWGLITFRESALFVDENNTKLATKQRVAETIIHELAHQWFGNLVTMKWWNDLWLNEGFASWAANFGVDKLFPEWNYWAQFISSDFSLTQTADSVPSSRPIEVEINDPDEIRSIFDEISYSKGPVVVRMLHQYLGDEVFRLGIKQYLETYSYTNATTDDLWNSLEKSSGKPINSFMSAWTSQSGFPLVTLSQESNKVKLTQERFLITGKDTTDKLWPVPITLQDSEQSYLFDSKSTFMDIDVSKHPKLNIEQGGLYIVSYPEEYLESLKDKVINQELGAVDRLGIIDDLLQLSKSSKGSIIDLVDLALKLEREENLVVWDAITGVFGNIRRVMDSEALIDAMRPKSKILAQYNLDRLGWVKKQNESSFDTLLRPQILGLAVFGDNQSVIDHAISIFDNAKSPEDITPDIRSVVYGAAVRFGDMKTFDKLLSFYRDTQSPQEKQSLAGAITGFKQPEINVRAFNLIKDEVKLQDTGFWIAYSFSNRYAKVMMWDWVKDNWDWIVSKFGEDIMTLSWIPEYSSLVFSDEDFLNDYINFWDKNSRVSIEREIKKGIENLKWQIDWKQRDFDKLSTYFDVN